MAAKARSHPFVAGLPPLFSGEVVSSRRRGDGVPVEVRRLEGRGHLVRLGEGASCYVVDGVPDADAALALAMTMPAPSPATTHTVLSYVCADPERGHVVRVESGEGIGAQVGPKQRDLLDRPGRVKQLSYFPATGYGYPKAEIPIRAFDLRYVASVHDEKWHSEDYTGRREGVIRSVWLADYSDELEDSYARYLLVRRERPDGGPMPQGSGDRGAGTIDDPVRSRSDLGPIMGPPMPTLGRLDVSPQAADNFRYVTEADDARREAIRRELLAAAMEKAGRELPIPFGPARAEPLSFERFSRTRREYRIDRPDAPYADPEGVGEYANVYAQTGDETFDGLVARREFYRMKDGVHASRYHVDLGGRKVAVGTSDVAEALLFLHAQAEGDKRLVPGRPALDFEAIAAAGRFHGYGWSSFALPELPDVYLRIREHGDGFSTPFSDEDERFQTAQAALEAAYGRFMEAAYGEISAPAP